ncbi:uncharacterized protein LOC127257830 isoform X2 [Andrographis paniculata]|uniref:uncharacterized protein LOC127257830 isoform X2 n=1 Tax=Andrographis paniculata TaxID=175694 RepID=UPI0021E7531B|nr:uncharacterized protein LOC127257830 isoform X2 [Andrographis paniculata]
MTKSSSNGRTSRAGFGIVPEELTEDNYEYWKVCLKNYLVGHGLWGVVSGKEIEPDRNQKQEHEEWKRKNALALHAIKMSCGPAIYSKFKQVRISARYAWNHLAEKVKTPHTFHPSDHEDESSLHEDIGMAEYIGYEILYKAIEEGNLKAVLDFLKHNPDGMRARISSHKDTALHIALLSGQTRLAEELVKMMNPEDLELTNEYGATPLSLAAIDGADKLAKLMVHKNRHLVQMDNEHEDGHLPVIVAAQYGQKHMVHYLYKVTPKEVLSPEYGENGATLLNCLITAEIYDVASMLLKRYPRLGVTPDHSGNYTLKILAHKPSAFPSATKLLFWEKWIYTCVRIHSPWETQRVSHSEEHKNIERWKSCNDHCIEIKEVSDEESSETAHIGQRIKAQVLRLLHILGWSILRCLVPEIKRIHHRKLIHDEAVKLLSCIFKEMRKMSKSELEKMDVDKIIYDAIKHGIVEFIIEMIKYQPEIVWRKDKKGRTIFSHAIVLRQENIFSLIYNLGTKKNIMARRHDLFGNNYLHLAAKLSPSNQLERVSGAALQMQREMQWYKEVESIVQPKLKEEANENNKTPSTVFSDEHRALFKDAERWMKNTAGSSMIVGTLIAAVMFTTAFTVPGGNENSSGLPTLLGKEQRPFLFFMVSNAISMFSSSTSVLMFLGILTARYAEKDFLRSLPTKLIFGLICLFFSIVTMMASFGSALFLILHKEVEWISVPIIVVSTIPIALFSILQFPILVEMTHRTYGSTIFKKPKKLLLRFSG